MSLPAPLRVYVRRPGWWLLVGVAVVAALLLIDVKTARDQRAWARGALLADAEVSDRYDGSDSVPVTYRNTVTDQDVKATAYLWNADLRPDAGAAVSVEFDEDDPLRIVVAGDRFPITGNLAGYTPIVVVPLLAWLTRGYSDGWYGWRARTPRPSPWSPRSHRGDGFGGARYSISSRSTPRRDRRRCAPCVS